MTKKKTPWLKQVKSAWNAASQAMKKLVGIAKEKVDLDSHFTRLAQKWDRISKGMVNLDPTFWGIFDREALTVTIRAADALQKGELIESEHVQYRIDTIRPDQVQVPVDIDHVTHLVPCRVAVLAKI